MLPARIKEPTHEMNPDKKLLKGKVPTSRQYRNCSAPVSRMYSRYASTTFSLLGVVVVYSSRNREMTDMTEFDMIWPSNLHKNGSTDDFCTGPLPQSNEWRVLINRKRLWCYNVNLPGRSEEKNTGLSWEKGLLAPPTAQQRWVKRVKIPHSDSISRRSSTEFRVSSFWKAPVINLWITEYQLGKLFSCFEFYQLIIHTKHLKYSETRSKINLP